MGAYKVLWVTGRDESQTVSTPEKLFRTSDLELPFLRDLSQAVRHTPRDTPVPFYTRTCSWPKKELIYTARVCRHRHS